MSTLDVTGMVINYPVNRPLTEHEQSAQLNVKKSQGKQPHYQLSLIKLNSTFAESIDKFYDIRGIFAMFMAAFSIFFLVIGITWLRMELSLADESASYFWPLFPILLGILTIYIFLQDAFTYTHYPIRFNRKNRMVYVWQRNGTVLKAPWDTLFFTTSKTAENNSITTSKYVAGHVLAEDGLTVKATFALSLTVGANESDEELKNHFEFYRLYMEEGAQTVLNAITNQNIPVFCLPPIDQTRESWLFGWQRFTLILNGLTFLQIISQVLIIPESFFRWVVMHTSKIPKWPEWVEQECAIEPNDPFVRDYHTNTTTVFGAPLKSKVEPAS